MGLMAAELFDQFQLLLLLLLGYSMVLMVTCESTITSFSLPLPSNCTRSCGKITIPFPFGIEESCFLSIGFNLSCMNHQRLLLGDGTLQIREIDTDRGILYIDPPMITMDVSEQQINKTLIDLKNLPYAFKLLYNRTPADYSIGLAYNAIYLEGCSAMVDLVDPTVDDAYIDTCFTVCSAKQVLNPKDAFRSQAIGDRCSLWNTRNSTSLGIQLTRLNQTEFHLSNASRIHAITYEGYSTDDDLQELITKRNRTGVRASLAWYIKYGDSGRSTCNMTMNTSAYACLSSNSTCHDVFRDSNFPNISLGYVCLCSPGYHGNPYIPDGCQGTTTKLSPANNCTTKCGNINVPFPFGLDEGCYRDESFLLKCINTSDSKDLLRHRQFTYIVSNISLEEGQLELKQRQYSYSSYTSFFTLGGEQKSVYMYKWVITSQNCMDARNSSMYACVDKHSTCVDVTNSSNGRHILGYRCKCIKGYQGNPYLTINGCKDIDECSDRVKYPCYGACNNTQGDYNCTCPPGWHGEAKLGECIADKKHPLLLGTLAGICSCMALSFLCAIVVILRSKWKRRHQRKMRERHFHQNHGLLLKQLISSGENNTQRTKIFSLEEIEKATNNFDKSRVLGRGGHGTVYKGILSDQHVVAIKKAKIMKKSEIDQFINEVAILSQINHRHIVRLFECCLESEVPLLIYEFISNGALSNHLHVAEGGNSVLSWEDRLRVAIETAGALAYLHSAALISIFHRDIKSSNILLDDHFTAKVSDFGASRFIPLDQTHIITAIQGTFDYLDPEYYQTSQLIQKSDVYSFGVILLEFLTGKKPIYTTEDGQDLNLSMHFLQAIRENNTFDLVDDRIIKESNKEELIEIFQLIQMCLMLKGVDRPTMKEVEHKLQSLRRIRITRRGHCVPEGDEETKFLLSTSSQAFFDGTSRNYSMEKEVMWSQYCPR